MPYVAHQENHDPSAIDRRIWRHAPGAIDHPDADPPAAAAEPADLAAKAAVAEPAEPAAGDNNGCCGARRDDRSPASMPSPPAPLMCCPDMSRCRC